MKTKALFFTLFVLLVTTAAIGVEKPKMNVQSINSNEILVTFKSPVSSQIEISIFNESNEQVYYKQSKKPISGFNKIFNVKHLDQGKYAMKVHANGLILENKIKIENQNISIGKFKEYLKPFFAYKNEKLVVTHLNFDKEKYQLSISDEKGLVYETKLENKSPLNSAYNLSGLANGTYYVTLNSENREYAYSFEKKR